MKAIVWGAFVVLSLIWTGGAVVAVELVEWSSGVLASGGAVGLADAAARVPLPAWLSPFIDLTGWREAVSLVASWIDSLSAMLPSLGESLGWITPAIWTVWGLGILALGVLTILASRLIRF